MENKLYTRQQIFEAIQYWTRQLKTLDENVNKTIDMLVDAFGEMRVFSHNYDYILTSEDLEKIYKLLNYSLFNNILGTIQLEYWPEAFIISKMNENSLKSGVFNSQVSSAQCYGAFSAVAKDIVGIDNNVMDIDIVEPIIMINKTYLKKCIFIFAVASICHEMIHYYDSFSKEFHLKYIEWKKHNTQFDQHKDKVFQEMLRIANEQGIDVEESLTGYPYAMANMKARCKLRNILDEDDEDVQILATHDMLLMSAKGSNKSVFTVFD